MVLQAGFGPARPFGHQVLGLARLPDFATGACFLVPEAGFEPATRALSTRRSPAELPGY